MVYLAGDDLIVESIFALIAGLWLFYKGFKDLRLHRLIDGLATSRMRSAALGTVEICGFGEPLHPINDPIYGLPCVYFRLEVKEERGSGKNKSWVTVYKNSSDAVPFYLSDETGKLAVAPAGAELYCEADLDLTTGLLSGLSGQKDHIHNFLAKIGHGYGNKKITAYFLREQEPLYVLGYLAPLEDPLTLKEKIERRSKEALAEILRHIKSDPQRMKSLDTNGDGVVDPQEWDAGVRELKERLAKEALTNHETAAALFVRKGPEGLLIISDKSEKELLSSLGRWAWVKIIGGPALVLASLAYLLNHFQIL